VRKQSYTTTIRRVKEWFIVGRTKRGNANAQRNKNKKEPNRVSEELVEFTTGSKERKDQPVID
jgi:hypothetical protein